MAFSPVIIGIILVMLPLVFNKGERSALRRPWTIAVVIIMATVIGTFWYFGTKSPWSPAFNTKPLSAEVIGNVNPAEMHGAELFYKKACIYCHAISENGGSRGPDLTHVGNRLTNEQLIIKIVNGGVNMPSFGSILSSNDLNDLTSFLMTRKQ